ncbi:hypothetical protein SXANM310S_04318 [Streptomyces xanthochromogenes]
MIRQPPRHKPTQLHRLQNTPHLRRHIRHQTPVPRPILTDQHHHLPHPHMRHQRRLDLTQLDTETPHLHLVVRAADVGQLPVVIPEHEVTGAIHPLAVAPGVGDEAPSGQAGPVEVAAGQTRTRHVQLSHHAGWHGPQRLIQNIDARVPEGAADGHGARIENVLRGDAELGAVDRGFGRPVGGDHGQVRMRRAHPSQCMTGQHFPAEDQRSGRGDFLRKVLEYPEVGRGDFHERGPAGRPGAFVQFGQDHPPSTHQGCVKRGDRQVESDGGIHQRRTGRVGVHLSRPDQIGTQSGVFYHHALGLPGGAGGVDDVCGVGRMCGCLRVARRTGGQIGQLVEGEHRARIAEEAVDAVLRVIEIDRQVGSAGFQHTEDRDDEVGGAR